MSKSVGNEQSWQKMNQANVVSSVAKAFVPRDDFDGGTDRSSVSSSIIVPSITEDSLETLTSNDAHKLANVLQQQLDAINEELAYVLLLFIRCSLFH